MTQLRGWLAAVAAAGLVAVGPGAGRAWAFGFETHTGVRGFALAVGPDGSLWSATLGAINVGDRNGNLLQTIARPEFSLLVGGSAAALTLGPDGNMCPTDSSAACLAPAGPTTHLQLPSGGTAAVLLTVTSSGAIPLDPARTRLFIRFTDAAGVVRGLTSVALTSLVAN